MKRLLSLLFLIFLVLVFANAPKNAVPLLVFCLGVGIVVGFLGRIVANTIRRRRGGTDAGRVPLSSMIVAGLALVVLAVQTGAIVSERARYRRAEEAVRTAPDKAMVEARLGTPRGFKGKSGGEPHRVFKDEWVYNFDSPISPYPFPRDMAVGFSPSGTVSYAYWKNPFTPPSDILLSPATRSPSADESHAETAEVEPHAEAAEGAEDESHAESAENAEAKPRAATTEDVR